MNHLNSQPNSILFVYGPKSSGKSSLMISSEEIKEYLEKRRFFKSIANTIESKDIPDEYWRDYDIDIPSSLQEEMIKTILE